MLPFYATNLAPPFRENFDNSNLKGKERESGFATISLPKVIHKSDILNIFKHNLKNYYLMMY